MAEERKIRINFQGKEVKTEQLTCYHGQHGETIYDLQRKNCKVILNSTGEKNVIVVADQHGKINWLGTFSNDITLKVLDLVMFKDEYMARFNCASVVDTIGIRYTIPTFNYFEKELIAEEADEIIEPEPEVIIESTSESTVELVTEPVENEENTAMLIAENIASLKERSGLTN